MTRLAAAVTAAAFLLPALPASASAPAARSAPLSAPISAAAAASYDAVGERFVEQVNAGTPLAPASLTKMLVALLVAEQLTPDTEIVVSHRAATTRPDNIRWPEGAVYTVDDMLHAMMMESSNGAAIAFADHIAGSVPTFVEMMNERAKSIGATNTHIVDPSGLDAPGQHSTAHDLALIAAEVIRDPWLARVVRTRSRAIPWINGGTYTLHTLDGWLVRYPGAIGVKNGYTTQAGNCLAAAAHRNGRTVVTVVLGDRRWYADSVELMSRAFPRSLAGELRPRSHAQAAALVTATASTPAGPGAGRPVGLATLTAFAAAAATVTARRRQVIRRRRARAQARELAIRRARGF